MKFYLRKLSPFLLNKVVVGCCGTPKYMEKLSSSVILINVKDEKQSCQLLTCKNIGHFSVVVEPYRTLNSSHGVVYFRDFIELPLTEILVMS